MGAARGLDVIAHVGHSAIGHAAAPDPVLVDPVCQGSVLTVPGHAANPMGRLLFLNPGGPGRSNLTLRASDDGGNTWSESRVVVPGPAAYSDLCLLPGGRLGLFYECGESRPYERLRWQILAL